MARSRSSSFGSSDGSSEIAAKMLNVFEDLLGDDSDFDVSSHDNDEGSQGDRSSQLNQDDEPAQDEENEEEEAVDDEGESDEESGDSEEDDSEDESNAHDAFKLVVKEAPLLRLENVTSQTRSHIPEGAKQKQAGTAGVGVAWMAWAECQKRTTGNSSRAFTGITGEIRGTGQRD